MLLGIALLASGALVLGLFGQSMFFIDDWEFLLNRDASSPDAYLAAHNGHISIATVAVFKAPQAVFGMASPLPFHAVTTTLFLLSAVLLFVYVRRRIGEWPALAAAILILFLGPATADLFWISTVGFLGSVAFGLGMLLALDRGDRWGDRLACVLLIVSISFQSAGLAFLVGAAVQVATDHRPWRERAFIVAVPLALYAAWWLGWGQQGHSALSAQNLLHSPGFVFDSAASAVLSLSGLASVDESYAVQNLWLGRLLLVLLGALALLRLRKGGVAPGQLLVVLAIGLSFWMLIALNAGLHRHPVDSRYQFAGAVFVLLIATELLRGTTLRRFALAGILAATALVTVSNVDFMRGAAHALGPVLDRQRANLGALEIARPALRPDFDKLTPLPGLPEEVWVDAYLSAVDAFGSPAYDQAELARSSATMRTSADRVLATALGIELRPSTGASPTASPAPIGGAGGAIAIPTRGCRELPLRLGGRVLRLPPGGVALSARDTTIGDIELARFATGRFPVELGPLQPHRTAAIAIPPDRSRLAWRMRLSGTGTTVACGLPGRAR